MTNLEIRKSSLIVAPNKNRVFRLLLRTFHTVRYLSAAQMHNRGLRICRNEWRSLRKLQAPEPKSFKITSYQMVLAGLKIRIENGDDRIVFEPSKQRARAMASHVFSFLGQECAFDHCIQWDDSSVSQLWRFNLHSFSFTQDLMIRAALGEVDDAYETFRDLTSSWIKANVHVKGDAWHPYTISIRVPNWLTAASWFAPHLEEDGDFRDALFRSIYAQGRILRNDLEFDLRGNHLLENVRALLWLGVAFRGQEAEGWFRDALLLLQKEINTQILADGGHVERNPGYHLLVLQCLLETALLLRYNRGGSPAWLDETLRRMANFIVAIVDVEGDVPLMKDTTFDATFSPFELVNACALYLDDRSLYDCRGYGPYLFLLFGKSGQERIQTWSRASADSSKATLTALHESGFYVLRNHKHRDHMLIDIGKTCPRNLPGHTHADALSFELCISGKRMIVDSGVYEYANGPWREYFRSTRAHNTVEICRQNQSEVWGSFRVARRADPQLAICEERNGYTLLSGWHDGYKRLPSRAGHKRSVVWVPDQSCIILDQVAGISSSEIRSFIHFHPDCPPRRFDNDLWVINGTAGPVWLAHIWSYQGVNRNRTG